MAGSDPAAAEAALKRVYEIKDNILRGLQKLNEKSTQKNGIEELHDVILKQLDADTLAFFVNAIIQPGSESKPWTRKESIRLMVTLTSEATCPHAQAVLQNSTLITRMCQYLKTRMADADGGVRETAAEVTAQLAKNYRAVTKSWLPGSYGNAIMRVALDGLQAQNRELQSAAASALQQMAPYVTAPDPAMLKQLLRYLSSSSFHAKPQVLLAFAAVNETTGQAEGFISQGLETIRPLMGALIGTPPRPPLPQGASATTPAGSPNGIGILGCLMSQDWQVRKAAAESLIALATLLGPDLDEGVPPDKSRVLRCVECLTKAKHDRVKPVRIVMTEALNICTSLHSWTSDNPSGSVAAWKQKLRLDATKRGTKTPEKRSVSPYRKDTADDVPERSVPERPAALTREPISKSRPPSGSSARSESTIGAIRTSSAYNQFLQRAALSNNTVSVRDSGPHVLEVDVKASDEDPTGAWPQGLRPPQSDLSPTREALSARYSPGDLAAVASLELPTNSRQQANFERDIIADMNQLTHHVTSAIEALELRVANLESGAVASSTIHHNPIFTKINEPPTPTTPGDTSALPPLDINTSPEASPDPLPNAAAAAPAERTERDRDPPPVSPAPAVTLKPLSTRADSGVGSRVGASNLLTPQASEHLDDASSRGRVLHASEHGPVGSPGASTRSLSLAHNDFGAANSEYLDTDGTYRKALGASDQQTVLRLMQQTTPVWNSLQQSTARQLLDLMCSWLERGVALPLLLPWLYRLADEANDYVQSLPLPEQQARLSRAVARVNSPEDTETTNKYMVLADTLSSVWAPPEPLVVKTPNNGGTRLTAEAADSLFGQLPDPGDSPMVGVGRESMEVRQSVASLRALQMTLTDLERRVAG